MKKLFLCFCLLFLSAEFAQSKEQRKIITQPNLATSETFAKKDFPNIFRKIKNGFKKLFKKRSEETYCPVANVTGILLSQTEVMANCLNNSCSDKTQLIEISTETLVPDNNPIAYAYTISGGKIVGKGAKVVWDLSDIKPGIYTITAAVDDGCGFCGATVTKEVKVIECPNCN